MDLSNNSELLRYANAAMEEPDVNEESFYVVERETLSTSPPQGESMESMPSVVTGSQEQDRPVHQIVAELAAASDPAECHITDIDTMTTGSNLSVLPSGIDLENCSVEIERLKEENLLLQDEVKKQQGKMKEVMEQCRQIGVDAHRLREEDTAKYEQSRLKIEHLEKENEELKVKLLETEKQCKDLQEKLTVLESNVRSDEFVAVVEDQKEEHLAQAKRRLEELQELLSLEKAQTDELKKKLRDIQASTSEAQASEKSSIVELNKKIVENDEIIQTLRAQLESSFLELDNLKKEIERRTTEKDVLAAQNEGILNGNQGLQARLSEVQALLNEMTLVKEQRENACTVYQEQIERLQSGSSSSTAIEGLKEQLLARDDQIQTLQVSLESSQIALEETKKWCDIVSGENAELRKTREGLLKEVEDLHSERVSKRKNDEDIRKEIEELRTENRSLNERLRDRDSSFQEISIAKQKCEEVCAKYKDRNQKLNGEVEQLEQLIQQLKKTPGATISNSDDDEASRLRVRLTQLDSENSMLKTQIAALSTENESIDHWKAQCNEYAAEYQRAVGDRAALEMKLAELNAQLEELKTKEATQQKELTDLHQTHLRLAQEHVNGEPADSFASSGSGGGNESRKSDDIIGQVLSQFKRGVSSLFWDSDGEETPSSSSAIPQASTSQPARENVPSAPPGAVAAAAVGSGLEGVNQSAFTELPPCPVCSRVFYSYDNLVKHCETCGDHGSVMSTNSYGSHMDPFVFVPQQ